MTALVRKMPLNFAFSRNIQKKMTNLIRTRGEFAAILAASPN
jgi:hypothetical protein